MKKLTIFIMVFVLAFVFSTRNLKAQAEDIDLFVNAGILTGDEFKFDPFTWSGGVNLDVHLTGKFMLSPECNVIFQEFEFKNMWLAPGVILNAKFDLFFAGAGISKWFKLAGNVGTTKLQLKINAGFRSAKYRVTVYLESPLDGDLFFKKNSVIFGATIGMAF